MTTPIGKDLPSFFTPSPNTKSKVIRKQTAKLIAKPSSLIIKRKQIEKDRKFAKAEKAKISSEDIIAKINTLNNRTLRESLAGIYINTNESNAKEISKLLKEKRLLENSCHIGFSGWHNFDIIVQRKSAYGVIRDYNFQNKSFINQTLKILESSSDRFEFVDKFNDYIKNSTIEFSLNIGDELVSDRDSDTPMDEVNRELNRKGSWLNTDEGFEYIKQLSQNARIAVITEDIRNTPIFSKIKKLIKDKDLKVDTLYLSNISHYMRTKSDKKKFSSTVRVLTNTDTAIINCPKAGSDQAPIQELLSGREVKEKGSSQLFVSKKHFEEETSK